MASKLSPPDDLGGAALDEWRRVVAALKAEKRPLKSLDRSVLDQYVRVWQLNRHAHQEVNKAGSVIEYPNGMTGPSPHYRVVIDTGKQLRGLLNDLGLTPAARKFASAADEAARKPAPLKF